MTEFRSPVDLALKHNRAYGNPDAMANALAEDAQWWISPSAPSEITPPISEGREAVRDSMRRDFSVLYKPGTVETTVHRAIGQGDLATVRFTLHARLPNDAPYENEYTQWIETRDGAIVKVWDYVDVAWAIAVMRAAGIEVSALSPAA